MKSRTTSTAGLALALAATTLTLTPSPAPAAAGSALTSTTTTAAAVAVAAKQRPRPVFVRDTGFKSRRGWVGSWRRRGSVELVFQVGQGRSPRRTGPATPSPAVVGGNRAAWIVSKYGRYPERIQSAAVDVAVRSILQGPAWGLYGSHTNARLKPLPRVAAYQIRKLAAQMVSDSLVAAGPYTLTATSTAGSVTATLTSKAGRPVPSVLVRAVGPVGSVIEGSTDLAGTIVLPMPGNTAGAPITVTAVDVPRSVPVIRVAKRARHNRWIVATTKEQISTAVALGRVQAR